MTLEKVKLILSNFEIDGNVIYFENFGSGHINTTYAVYLAFENKQTKRYILQKINTNIFKNPIKLIDNIASVTGYLHEKIIAEGGNPSRETLTLSANKDGTFYYIDENNDFYRIYEFIEDATCYQIVTKELFYSSAVAFGKFAKQLDGFDASEMFDIIEKFHHTVNRFNNFENSVSNDAKCRAKDISDEISFVRARKDFCSIILDEIDAGTIPLRVCHNDTKLNNVMIDNITHKGLCVIDLDTVMKGSLLYDFGDSIRFGASSALEDEVDLQKVYLDLAKYEMYVKGYLEETSSILSAKEFELLAHSAILMTFECGMRFLSDYLDGDVYFKIHKDDHNLIRARNQFKLVSDMEEKLDEMIAINNKYK